MVRHEMKGVRFQEKDCCLMNTYKHRYNDYGDDDILLVGVPSIVEEILTVKVAWRDKNNKDQERKLKITRTGTCSDALTRILDGGIKFALIISKFDEDFMQVLRDSGYKNLVFCVGKDVSPEKALVSGYDGVIFRFSRESLRVIMRTLSEVLKTYTTSSTDTSDDEVLYDAYPKPHHSQ